ncbi:MAG TPA: hypothetical protein VLN48_09280 [Bryobacteraceae bacterium]|nr:hypothetical protein [Bryobacteraceae bacterium]
MKVPLRTILLFFTAYGLNTIAHEFAHAVTAFSLGIPSTLFHYYVNTDFVTPDPWPRVWVAIAGPLFSLGFGLLCGLIYRRMRFQPSRLPWLYMSILGISIFLGNVFSTSFVGDFGTAAMVLNVTPNIRLVTSLLGLALAGGFLFTMGQELMTWAPADASRAAAALQMIAWPVVLGTVLVILAFLPLPPQFIAGWMATSLFWIFAAGGAMTAAKYATSGGDLRTRPFEYVAAVAVLAAVRLLTAGVRLTP